jgi:hypothetical protein
MRDPVAFLLAQQDLARELRTLGERLGGARRRA